jgi:hypothetical protein
MGCINMVALPNHRERTTRPDSKTPIVLNVVVLIQKSEISFSSRGGIQTEEIIIRDSCKKCIFS